MRIELVSHDSIHLLNVLVLSDQFFKFGFLPVGAQQLIPLHVLGFEPLELFHGVNAGLVADGDALLRRA